MPILCSRTEGPPEWVLDTVLFVYPNRCLDRELRHFRFVKGKETDSQ